MVTIFSSIWKYSRNFDITNHVFPHLIWLFCNSFHSLTYIVEIINTYQLISKSNVFTVVGCDPNAPHFLLLPDGQTQLYTDNQLPLSIQWHSKTRFLKRNLKKSWKINFQSRNTKKNIRKTKLKILKGIKKTDFEKLSASEMR